jgi:hypothetical protein
MNLLQYQDECERTKSPQFHGGKVARRVFVDRVGKAILALNMLDEVKKALFYDKQAVGLTVHEYDFTCLTLQIQRLHTNHQLGVDILHAILGKATEDGELLTLLLNSLTHEDQPFDRVNFIEEIGDGFWYDAIALNAVGGTFADTAERNNRKLRARFPDKFSEANAVTRDLPAERKQLETVAKAEDKESDGAMLQRLGTDADLWVREFVKRLQPDQLPLDIDTMRAWFANAIETGRNAEHWSGYSEAFITEFLGYLSGACCELHKVEVPKLKAVFDEFCQRKANDEGEALDIPAFLRC